MTTRPAKKPLLLVLSALIASICSGGPAYAAPELGVHPFVGLNYGADGNLLRFSDLASARATNGTDTLSDSYWRAEGGIDVATQLSDQVLSARINLNHTRYAHFRMLDYNGRVLQGLWNWHVGSHLDGNLGIDYVRSLTPFADYHGFDRNMRTVRHAYFDGEWDFHPRWSVRAGLVRDTWRYDLITQQVGDRVENTVHVGVNYDTPGNSRVGLQLMRTRGEFPNSQQAGTLFIDNDYRQDALLAKIDWRVTPISRFQLDAGWLRRRHEAFTSRNFSGPVARLTFSTVPSGKTTLLVAAWREVSASGDVTAVYTVNRGLSVTPAWNISGKLKLEGLLKAESLAFSGNPVFISLPALEQRQDHTQNATLTLSYRPRDRMNLSAAAYRDKRTSNIAQLPYVANGVLFTARYQF